MHSSSEQTLSKGSPVQWLSHSDNSRIAYVEHTGKQPTALFCGGFNSDMTGTKALHLEQTCLAAGYGFIRFDYRGHGISSGELWQHTISDWIEDAALLVEQVIKGQVVLVGSSMGVWVMCHMMKRFSQRIAGCVGIAGAPDFTENLLQRLIAEQREALKQGKIVYAPTEYDDNGYALTQKLFDEGKQQLVLDKPIRVDFPVRLFHGTNDNSVPWQQSLRLMECLQGDDIQLTLIKDGDHRLSNEDNLAIIAKAVLDIFR